MTADQSGDIEDGVRLDSVGLEALAVMQKIVQRKLEFQEYIKSGSINLAKSRYIMGNRSVSTSQLPTEDSTPFNALCKVEHSFSQTNDVTSPVFTLSVQEPQKKQKPDKNDESREGTPCDPLHWFGVLVPQNLRTAQDSFKKAVELSIEIANLQSHLEALRMDFCTLKLGLMSI